MSEELRPCPFCGGEAKLSWDYSSERDVSMWSVYHFCDGPVGRYHGYGSCNVPFVETPWYDGDEGRQTAIDAWNRRAQV